MRNKTSSISGVAFVVVGWNNKDLIDECLQSIASQTYQNCKVVYVDNGSEDGSVEHIKKNHPQATVVDAKTNHGFAIANNIGIAKALEDIDCHYVALLNTDARVAPDWAEKLIMFAANRDNVACMQSPTYDYYDHDTLDSYGIQIDHKGRAIQLGYRMPKSSLPDTQIVFGTNAAANMLTRKFIEAQPFGKQVFDEDLWMYLEDVDLAARATVLGWDNWFVNESAAYHMGSASSNKNPGFSVHLIYRNSFPMLYKNLPLTLLVKLIPGLIETDLRTALSLAKGKNLATLKAMARGRIDGVALTRKMIKKRSSIRRISRTKSSHIWSMMGSTPIAQ